MRIVNRYNASAEALLLPAIDALQDSVSLQPRNAEGGLWYYNNVANLSAYRGLSYLDGMYSYPLFAILSAASENTDEPARISSVCDDVYEQFRILYQRCGQPSGLLAHGYDALHDHSWADRITGASPVVWGRALAWYSLGLLNILQSPALEVCSPLITLQLRQLLEDVLEAQLAAIEKSRVLAGSPYGVWQVVDRPYRPGNFVESSASFMTVYSLMRAAKLGLLPEFRHGRLSVTELATGIFFYNLHKYVVEYENGAVSLKGTSTVASLRGNVDYEVCSLISRGDGCRAVLTRSVVLRLPTGRDGQLAGNERVHPRQSRGRKR